MIARALALFKMRTLVATLTFVLVAHASVRTAIAQTESAPTAGEIEEIAVELWHQSIGSTVVPAVLVGKAVYLQPSDIFTLAKIRADLSDDPSILKGYYISEVREYAIDLKHHTIEYQNNTITLTPREYISIASGEYIRTDIFDRVFGLQCEFDFSGLAVEMKSKEGLPAETEAQYAKQRKYLADLENGGPKPDRVFGLNRSLFSLGTVDWSAGGSYTNNVRSGSYDVLMGGQVLGGDFDAQIHGNMNEKIDWNQTPWEWRTAFPSSKVLSQILVGRKVSFANVRLPDTMVGVQFTNANTNYRSSFSTYTIDDRTEPNWTVELYINEALVNYVKADENGYFKFVIPLGYGSTNVKLKFYGPYGEVRTKTLDLQIPFSFLPPGNVEYSLSGGTSINNPSVASAVSQGDVKIGVTNFLTLGGGSQYVRQEKSGAENVVRPYGYLSMNLTNSLLLSGQYFHNEGFTSNFAYTGPHGISLDASFDHRFTNPYTNADGYRVQEQRRARISLPVPFIGSTLRVSGTDIPVNKDSGNLALSAQTYVNFWGLSFSLGADYNFLRDVYTLHNQYASGTVGLSSSIFGGYFVRTAVGIDIVTHKATGAEFQLMKTFGEWLALNVAGRHDFATNDNSLQADLHFALPFANVGFSSSIGETQKPSYGSSIQGSFGYDAQASRFYASNQSSVRRGGITIIPFLDENDNGVFDDNEQLVRHFGLEQSPGRVIEHASGTLTIPDLEPYRKYYLKTSTADLENISWVPKFQSFEVAPPANGFATVEVPLVVVGQIQGYVTVKNPQGEEPIGGVRLKLRHNEAQDTSDVQVEGDFLSYSNGEFYYMGLTPGKYRIYLDPKQLALFRYDCSPGFIDFELHSKAEGDIVEGLNFLISKNTNSADATVK